MDEAGEAGPGGDRPQVSEAGLLWLAAILVFLIVLLAAAWLVLGIEV